LSRRTAGHQVLELLPARGIGAEGHAHGQGKLGKTLPVIPGRSCGEGS